MYVKVNKIGSKATIEVGAYEGFTIWLGLKALATSYEEDLEKDDRGVEDKMFLHHELGKVYQMMFELTENFEPAHKKQAQAFFEDAFPQDRDGNPTFIIAGRNRNV